MSPDLTPLDRLVRERIETEGSLAYEEVIDLALYHPEHGFYSTTGQAGRRGDFITSPEVGPLFGQLIGNYLDQEWDRCGNPDQFVFVDAGAGPGTLARTIAAAAPRCWGSLQYVAVEVSETQRTRHPDFVDSRPDLPAEPFNGVVFANELLDNLAFHPVERIKGDLTEMRVALVDGDLVEVAGDVLPTEEARHFEPGLRRGIAQPAAAKWMERARSLVQQGSVVIVDYARASSDEVEVRTYRGHDRGVQPLVELGRNDITVDVDLAQLESRVGPASSITSQVAFLVELGIEDLVEEGRAIWHANAATGDLAALRARSRIRESEALLDPTGLGSFSVAIWR